MNLFSKEYKSWSVERISRHVLYWSFWLTFYGVVNGSYYEEPYADWFFFEFITMLVKVPYTYFIAYYIFPRYVTSKEYLKLGLSVLGYAFIGMLALMALNQIFPYPFGATDFWSTKTVYMFVDLIYVASPVVVIKMTQRYLKQERMATQLKKEKIEAELQILKNQLQPHFLFNTLNNIYGMVISGKEHAGEAILKLSDMISYMLYECSTDKVDLDKEVTLLSNYIELEKIRYGDRLELSFEKKGVLTGKMIPPLLLVPFVENAFKHGVSRDEKKPWVRIHLRVEEGSLSFLMENSLPNMNGHGSTLRSGVGLENVKKRLDLLYPDSHELVLSKTDTFLVKLNMEL